MLAEVEGALLGYWDDIPQQQVASFAQRIRECLAGWEPAGAQVRPMPRPDRIDVGPPAIPLRWAFGVAGVVVGLLLVAVSLLT
jgi:hypothetical protein